MRTTRSIATLLLACLAVLAPAGSAQAADVSKYWIYYSAADGEWAGYDEGFGSSVPEDGSVEGYRYGASTDIPAHITPRADLSEVTFDAVCGDVEAKDGQKRVAVVVDFGVEADAPEGAEVPAPYADCAQVPAKATGYQVLDAVADLRVEQSEWGPSLCGIDSYPASGPCFATVKQASPDDEGAVDVEIRSASAESDTDTADEEDSNAPLLIGAGVVVALLAAGGALLARRNRS
jgi:hypothetical protein